MIGVLAAAALAPAACAKSVADPAVVEGVPGNGSAGELRLRWAQWRAVGPRSYVYDLRRACFCTTDYITPARVEVRGGTVVAARALTTLRPLRLELFEPIDSLFADAIRMAEGGGHVRVSYHPSLHYPTLLEIGTIANDAGVLHVVTALDER